MATRLEAIEATLRGIWGEALLLLAPDLPYIANRVLVRYGRTDDSLPALLDRLDSQLFNAVYLATGGRMTAPDGRRITTEGVRDMADRLLSLCYRDARPSPVLEDALYDLARTGSFAAMRELLARYELGAEEREQILRVLRENGELD